jgi:ATP-binding cassette subfamily B protein
VKGRVEFQDVTFGYGKGAPALSGVNLRIEPGTAVALVGATGSGKTTAANLIPRFYDPSSGRVLLDGVDVRDIKLKSLRSNVGIVSQDIFLFSASIRDNIAFGMPEVPLDQVVKAAKVAHADEFIDKLPEKYDTLVGERGVTLSGGQKQRIAIARTLITNPKILILDDSLSSVDVETEQAIQDSLKAVIFGRTSIIITQRISTLRLADRIMVFNQGQIVEEGTHSELMKIGGFYSDLYESQLTPVAPAPELSQESARPDQRTKQGSGKGGS